MRSEPLFANASPLLLLLMMVIIETASSAVVVVVFLMVLLLLLPLFFSSLFSSTCSFMSLEIAMDGVVTAAVSGVVDACNVAVDAV